MTEREKALTGGDNTPHRTRKELIKTIAIVFLAAMLVLTFFSNTIMNMSLPQVSVQCAEKAEVNEQIRGNGTISAGKTFSVKPEETRVVSAVHVKVGDAVKKGDVIYSLEGTTSPELAEAEKNLSSLEFDYRKALLDAGADSKYIAELAEIESARDEVNEAEKDLEAFDTDEYKSEKYISEYIKEETLETEISELEALTNEKYSSYSDVNLEIYGSDTELALAGLDTDDYSLLPSERYAELTAAKEKADRLSGNDKQRLADRKAELEAAVAALGTEDMLSLPPKYYARIENTLTARNDAKEEFQRAENELKDAQSEAIKDCSGDIKSKQRELEAKLEEYDTAMNKISAFDINEPQSALDELYKNANDISRQIKYLNEDINELMEQESSNSSRKTTLKNKQQLYDKYKRLYEKAEKELSAIRKEIKKELVDELMGVKEKLESVTGSADENGTLDEAKRELNSLKNEVRKELKERSSEITREISNRKSIKEKKTELQTSRAAFRAKLAEDKAALKNAAADKKKALAKLEAGLSVKKATDLVADEKAAIDLEKQESEISYAKEKVKTLKEKSLGGEIKAPVDGVISSLSLSAGESTSPGSDAAVIDMVDKGFIVSFSVKTEQARKLRTGVNADVTSNYFGSDISATLTKISNDPSNPQTNRLLEFTVTGADVHTGDQISLSIGSKGQTYPAVVPNSAMREDRNGKYVLVVESKGSALGSRYFAVRYPVDVLASNDSKTAVSGLTGSEFVITASSVTISDGMQVKLAE